MRTRLTRNARRKDILDKARRLFAERGFSNTEMEDIRQTCGISRGGLYHHFANRRAILDALVAEEVTAIAETLDDEETSPIPALVRAGSTHLGAQTGVAAGLQTTNDRLEYLSSLEQAFAACLSDRLGRRLEGHVRAGTDPHHVAELFLTVNAHINRREILGHWTPTQAAGFAATSLTALSPLLRDTSELNPIISELISKADT